MLSVMTNPWSGWRSPVMISSEGNKDPYLMSFPKKKNSLYNKHVYYQEALSNMAENWNFVSLFIPSCETSRKRQYLNTVFSNTSFSEWNSDDKQWMLALGHGVVFRVCPFTNQNLCLWYHYCHFTSKTPKAQNWSDVHPGHIAHEFLGWS